MTRNYFLFKRVIEKTKKNIKADSLKESWLFYLHYYFSMQKILACIFGLIFIGSSTYVFTSEAHNRSYAQWHNDHRKYHQRPIRGFSNRVAAFKYRQPSLHRLKYHNLDYSHPSRRHDAFSHDSYRTRTINYRVLKELNRLRNPQFYPRNENRFHTGRIVVRNGDYREASIFPFRTLEVYDRANIGIRNRTQNRIVGHTPPIRKEYKYDVRRHLYTVPYGFYKTNDGTYRSKSSSLAFRIVQTPTRYSCVQTSFEACAIDLSKEFQDSQNLVYTSRVDRKIRSNQTVQGSFLRVPTVTESFHATGFGKNNAYFILNAFNPENGSVIRIEAVANHKETRQAAQIMYKVFESFRFQLAS